jgi:LruC domain-containing protein
MDSARRPWALDIPVEWVHPKENTDISKAYPKIIDWAKSSGTTNRDWYKLPSTPFLYKAP